MINAIVRRLTGKSIALYENHRQVLPLKNHKNRNKYFFVKAELIWQPTRLFGNSRYAFRLGYLLLSILRPAIILSKNWVVRRDIVYYVWSKNNQSKFVVVQHGAYIGGNVTLFNHRYARCDFFYTWGPHYQYIFTDYNRFNRHCRCIEFGNPIYNESGRDEIEYPTIIGNRILLLPSTRLQKVIDAYHDLAFKLTGLGFEVYLKKHPKQDMFTDNSKMHVIAGDIYEILRSDNFDVVVSNHSTALIDAICFKKPVLYFDPEQKPTVYSRFLKNVWQSEDFRTLRSVEALIDISKQEELFEYMVTIGDNTIIS